MKSEQQKLIQEKLFEASSSLAKTAIEKQGFIPTPLKTLKNHELQTTLKIQEQIINFCKGLVAGLELIAKSDTQQHGVPGIAAELLANMNAPHEFMKIAEQSVIDNIGFFKALLELAEGYHGAGDIEEEKSIISALITFYPYEPQPYIRLGTLIWKVEGIEQAGYFYENITQILNHPMVDYLAADCFFNAGRAGSAVSLLTRALAHCDEKINSADGEPEPLIVELHYDIKAFLQELS